MRNLFLSARNDLLACQSGCTPLPIDLTLERAVEAATGAEVREMIPFTPASPAARSLLEPRRYARTFAEAVETRRGFELMAAIGLEAYEAIRTRVRYDELLGATSAADPWAMPRQSIRVSLLFHLGYLGASETKKAEEFIRLIALMRNGRSIVLGELDAAGRWAVLAER